MTNPNLTDRVNGVKRGCWKNSRTAPGRGLPEVPQTVIQRNPLKMRNQNLNVATWNVRTMNPYGSLEQIQKEAERLKIDILGQAEVRGG